MLDFEDVRNSSISKRFRCNTAILVISTAHSLYYKTSMAMLIKCGRVLVYKRKWVPKQLKDTKQNSSRTSKTSRRRGIASSNDITVTSEYHAQFLRAACNKHDNKINTFRLMISKMHACDSLLEMLQHVHLVRRILRSDEWASHATAFSTSTCIPRISFGREPSGSLAKKDLGLLVTGPSDVSLDGG